MRNSFVGRTWAAGGVSLVSLVGCGDQENDAGVLPGDAAVIDASTPDGGVDPRPDAGSPDADAGTDTGSTDAGATAADRAALEAAIRDACEFVVSCYPDEYTIEDCIGYYDAYVELALDTPGCAGPLTSYLVCLGASTCDAPDDTCESEGNAAAAACPEFME